MKLAQQRKPAEAQPALAADRQGAECESRECGFTFSAKMRVGRMWAAAEAPSLGSKTNPSIEIRKCKGK